MSEVLTRWLFLHTVLRARLVIARGCRPGKWFLKRESLRGADGPQSSLCGEDTEIPVAALTKTRGLARGARITTIPARNQPRICANPLPIFRTLPEVDASRIISVGISAGGFANVALTADPPPGLVAAISFAGGRGSRRPDEVCNPGELIRAFHEFGEKSRIPMLWVYSENDHFFGPQIAQAFYQAFTQAGGKATFIHAAPYRKDGPGLFSLGGISIWTVMVDDFLKEQNLVLRTTLLALPEPPDVSPPAQLKVGGREEFRSFLTLPPHKAFAVSTEGHFGYAFGRRSEKDAQRLAMEHCEENVSRGDHCALVPVDVASAEKPSSSN